MRERLTGLANDLPCAVEIVLVNDGSSDGSIDLLVKWAEADGRVKVFNLARNFGHQVAATAGLDHAAGQAVVLMDADLQDPPEVILDMLEEYRRGYDVIYGRRSSRAGETRFKRLSAWLFYRTIRLLVHSDLPADVGDFRLVSRACLDAVCRMREAAPLPEGHDRLGGISSDRSVLRARPQSGREDHIFTPQNALAGLDCRVLLLSHSFAP